MQHTNSLCECKYGFVCWWLIIISFFDSSCGICFIHLIRRFPFYSASRYSCAKATNLKTNSIRCYFTKPKYLVIKQKEEEKKFESNANYLYIYIIGICIEPWLKLKQFLKWKFSIGKLLLRSRITFWQVNKV